jgi:hypothetical protein
MITNWIDFGQVSAERDEHLSEYFYENGVLQNVIDDRHQFLILGRKGAGKTAVFSHFSDNSQKYLKPGDVSISLSLQNYSWDVHNLLASEGKASSLAYIQSWKYVIYLLAIKELSANGNTHKALKKAAGVIGRIYSSPAPNLAEVVGQKLLQLSSLKLPSGGLDLEGGALDSLSASGGEVTFNDVKNDSTLQGALNRSVERLTDYFETALLATMESGGRVFVTFDRIDEAWDTASFESSQRVISGLIGAAETISSRFKGSLRPVIFLREDIFDTLDLNDKNKLRSDCGQLLAWSRESLSRLILDRVNFFARRAGQDEFSRIEQVFDREQMRQQRAPFDYISLRTMQRPRDFIRFFQLVKGDMKERLENPYDEEPVDEVHLECQAIYNAEPAYSEWLLEELRDEWRVQFPRINELFSALQNYGSTTLTADNLKVSLEALNVMVGPTELNMYLRFMYDNSILGFRVGKGQQWKFKSFFKSQGFIESDLYKVHDGLHRGLSLTESRSS